MSMLSIYQTKAGKLRGGIASLNKKLSVEKAAQARKSQEANSTASSINKNTSASTLKTKLSKIDRLNSDLAKIQKNFGDIEGKIASKTKELHSAEQRVSKEQDKEDKKRRLAYLRRIVRADERTRTAYLLITSDPSPVAEVCRRLQFPHI
jgi:chromosome segregation ATPase